MDKYYERQFKNKEQSIRIPDKPNMEEYIERLQTIVHRWAVKRAFCRYPSILRSGTPSHR